MTNCALPTSFPRLRDKTWLEPSLVPSSSLALFVPQATIAVEEEARWNPCMFKITHHSAPPTAVSRDFGCHGSQTTTGRCQMMAQSDRYKRLRTRYEALSTRAAAGDSLVPDTAYADFLKELERQSLPHTVPDTSQSHVAGGRGGRGGTRPLSANTTRERAQKSLDESAKRLKAIEDHMWQHRQEERDLRRMETDIVKQRKQVQRSMKEYEAKITRRQAEETDTLLGKEADLLHYQQKDLHQKGEATKEHTKAALAGRQKLNEHTKKFMKTENELSWRYQTLLHSLERKGAEVEQLSKDFESKIRAKEEEQHRLKQELASLAITLNMEAQKRRVQVEEGGREHMRATTREIMDSHTREEQLKAEERSKVKAGTQYENNRRGLAQSLKSKQETLQSKFRQEGRNLADVRTRLKQNMDNQKFAAQEAEHIQLNMIGREIVNRVEAVDAKRRVMMEEVQRQRQEKNRREQQQWAKRKLGMENEARMREHEERLKQLSAKNAEAQRKKQLQTVVKMQTDLEQLQRVNARKLKEAVVQAQQAETELQQKIVRETAELTKAANIREETLRELARHRNRSTEDRKMLADERREHQRRARIANRTTMMTETT